MNRSKKAVNALIAWIKTYCDRLTTRIADYIDPLLLLLLVRLLLKMPVPNLLNVPV